MSESGSVKARCLCGDVTFSVANVSSKFSVCHCETCRAWGGGPLFAVPCGADVEFDSMYRVTVYDSSEWASRGFCGSCGTHLFYRFKSTGAYNMSLGLFPELKDAVMHVQYYSDQRPGFYCFENKARELTSSDIEDAF